MASLGLAEKKTPHQRALAPSQGEQCLNQDLAQHIRSESTNFEQALRGALQLYLRAKGIGDLSITVDEVEGLKNSLIEKLSAPAKTPPLTSPFQRLNPR